MDVGAPHTGAAHFFLINREIHAVETALRVRDSHYQSATDAVSGESLECDGQNVKLQVPGAGGRWVRCEKSEIARP